MGNCVAEAGQPGLAVVGIAVGELADKRLPVADDALLGLEADPELANLAVASLQEQFEGGNHFPRHWPEPDPSAQSAEDGRLPKRLCRGTHLFFSKAVYTHSAPASAHFLHGNMLLHFFYTGTRAHTQHMRSRL